MEQSYFVYFFYQIRGKFYPMLFDNEFVEKVEKQAGDLCLKVDYTIVLLQ